MLEKVLEDMKLKSKNRKQWNEEDGTSKKSEDVNKRWREKEKNLIVFVR